MLVTLVVPPVDVEPPVLGRPPAELNPPVLAVPPTGDEVVTLLWPPVAALPEAPLTPSALPPLEFSPPLFEGANCESVPLQPSSPQLRKNTSTIRRIPNAFQGTKPAAAEANAHGGEVARLVKWFDASSMVQEFPIVPKLPTPTQHQVGIFASRLQFPSPAAVMPGTLLRRRRSYWGRGHNQKGDSGSAPQPDAMTSVATQL